MQQQLYQYRNSPVSYYRFGTGKHYLVAFHGYGQTGADYAYFEEELGTYFTVIAIDFFWHGKSEWREENDFTETDMRDIVIGIARNEKIVARKFTIMSFSMGARMARALVRTFPERIEQIIFISPPTKQFNHFLNFTVGTRFGLFMFNRFLEKNKRLEWWVNMLYRFRILNLSVKIFTSKFISKPERLQKVYNTWLSQRRLRTNYKTFAKLVDQHGIEVILIAGKNDTITPPHQTIRFIKKLKKRRLFIIPKKHELQTPETKIIFRKLFKI